MFIVVARPLLVSTPMSTAKRPLMFDQSSEHIDVTGVTTATSTTTTRSTDQPWQTRCQLFDTNTDEKTENPFSSIHEVAQEEYETNDHIDDHLYEDNTFPEIV